METTNTTFARLLLSMARKDAAAAGVDIPKGLSTSFTTCGNQKWYEVYSRTGMVWQGSASTASHAKSKYIDALVAMRG